MLRKRQHLPVPNFPKPAQLIEQRWFLASEVAALARIVGEVEQKLPLRHFEVFPMVAASLSLGSASNGLRPLTDVAVFDQLLLLMSDYCRAKCFPCHTAVKV